MKCTICGDAVDVENMVVRFCGHVSHATCLKKLMSSKRKGNLCEPKCAIFNPDFLHTSWFHYVQDDCNTQVLCTICNDEFTDINNMAATKCGHLFHYECIVEYVRPRAKSKKCLVESCEQILKLRTTFQIIPNRMDLQKNVRRPDMTDMKLVAEQASQEDDQSSEELCEECDEEETDMKSVAVQASQEDDQSSEELCEESDEEETDMKSVAVQTSHEDDQSSEECNVCDEKDRQIETLKMKMSDMNELKDRYQREIKNLKARAARENKRQKEMNKMKKKYETLKKDIREWESHYKHVKSRLDKTLADLDRVRDENKTLKKNTETLQSELSSVKSRPEQATPQKDQSLQSQATPGTLKEGQASSHVKEMDIMKEKYEILKKDIRKWESHCSYVKSKLGKAHTEIVKVKDENETLKNDIASLQSHCTYVKSNLRKSDTEITKEKDENETLKKDIASLQSQVSFLIAELGEAKSKLSEMDKVKKENKALLKDVQDLQSDVITARDANIGLQTEMRDLAAQNENLSTLNEDMKNDLKQLKDYFAMHESSINDFMINEAQRIMEQDAAEQSLNQQIRTLKSDNENLRRDNHELRTENKYRWELLATIRSTAPSSEDIPR